MANDFESGVWRTVGGRRIFIRDGEDLSDAMKKSGKFKSTKKKQEKEFEIESPMEEEERLERERIQRGEDEKKAAKKASREYKKKLEEDDRISKEMTKEEYKDGKYSFDRDRASDIEEVSGLKVKEAFETDLYGNGKADRFVLEDGRIVEHTLESFGQKEDTWSIHPKGMQGKSEYFDSFKEVKDYLKKKK